MKRNISIPLKAFSINSMYHKNRSWTTDDYKQWSSSIFHKIQTDDNIQAFKDLREFFDESKHAYIIDLKFYYPRNVLFKKSGGLSARAHDLSNIEKPLIDLIFLPKYFKQPSPYGCENLNIDDKYIYELSSKKLPAEEHRIDIELTIITP